MHLLPTASYDVPATYRFLRTFEGLVDLALLGSHTEAQCHGHVCAPDSSLRAPER
jgi:hypothetical protein